MFLHDILLRFLLHLINREQELRREKKVFFLLHCTRTDRNFYHVAMTSAAKRSRRKSQREAASLKRQGVPGPVWENEDLEVHFKQVMDTPESPPASPPPSPTSQGETDYCIVLDMVQNLRDKLSALNLDNDNIRAACLRRQCQYQGIAFGNWSKLVKQSLEGRQPQQPQEETGRPHPIIRLDLMDSRGNLRATDIGITWQGGDTFLRGRTGRRHRRHTAPTGDVNTIPAGTRTPLMWNVNTTASTSGVHGNS